MAGATHARGHYHTCKSVGAATRLGAQSRTQTSTKKGPLRQQWNFEVRCPAASPTHFSTSPPSQCLPLPAARSSNARRSSRRGTDESRRRSAIGSPKPAVNRGRGRIWHPGVLVLWLSRSYFEKKSSQFIYYVLLDDCRR